MKSFSMIMAIFHAALGCFLVGTVVPYDLLPQNSIADFLTKSYHCECEATCLCLIVFSTVKATDLIVVTFSEKFIYEDPLLNS